LAIPLTFELTIVFTLKIKGMARLLLIIGLILVVLWLLGFFAFHLTNPVIHALIIIGIILILLDLLNSRRNWW